MKLLMRIWVTALIIQPFLFVPLLSWSAVIIVPIEIAGSLPILILFWLIMKGLAHAPLSLARKSILLMLAAVLLSTLASLAVVLIVGALDPRTAEDYLPVIPAPLSALAALFIHHKQIRHFLSPDPETAEAF